MTRSTQHKQTGRGDDTHMTEKEYHAYPTVTQVLGVFADWSSVPPERLELASERGTIVHQFCAAYAQGLWLPRPKGLEGYCESFQRWFDIAVQQTLAVEYEVLNKEHGYIGHLDWLGFIRGDDKPRIIDLKTPTTKNALWAAQCAAYLNAVRGWQPSRCGSLRLKADGTAAIYDEYTDSARDFQAFLNALYAYKYFRG